MPVMYPIAAVSLMACYAVSKCLLLRYYSKTVEFNARLPMWTVELMKYGRLFHVVIVILMLSNEQLMPIAASENIKAVKQAAFGDLQ